MEMELMGTKSLKRAKRTTDLIANFVEGYADGWHLALKESFKMELDIKLTERKKNKIAYYEWIQGPYFCFSEGQIFYDVKEAYSCWQDALKKVNLACQIVASKPNIPLKILNEISEKTEFWVIEGNVQFVLFRPDEGRTKLIPFVGYNLTQNDFVDFLKNGKL
jgi:hypothetical protein